MKARNKKPVLKGWKIVRSFQSNLLSAITMNLDVRVEYFKNKWVVPRKNCGPLCVFSDYGNALKFVSFFEDDYENKVKNGEYLYWRIFKCEYFLSKENIVCFMCNNGYGQIEYLDRLPVGTALADKVKIIGEK